MIKVLLFAGIAEKLGKKEIDLDPQFDTVRKLVEWMQNQYPQIKDDIQHSFIALNEEYCEPEAKLGDRDVVAIIPPVSGG